MATPRDPLQQLYPALLGAEEPLTAESLAEAAGLGMGEAREALESLARAGRVVAGRLVRDSPERLYRWADHWVRELERRTEAAREQLRTRVAEAGPWTPLPPEPSGPAAGAFAEYVCTEYRPPEDKRLLVILQCSVRRPFSSSPSHASMRRAISVATGLDPAHEFARCPVHVVVLASRIGPVPYELESIHPASVSCGGVKALSPDEYLRIEPVLAERFARYLTVQRAAYDHVATFTEGRYAEVIAHASELSGTPVTLLPREPGPLILRRGRTRPRKYWEQRWLQLTLALLEWLRPEAQPAAQARLAAEDLEWVEG
jgi:hypothetical protein